MKNYIKRWYRAIKAPKDLIELVKIEADALKKNAKFFEINQLSFHGFNPLSRAKCIYGQMTGNCDSERANQLVIECAHRVYIGGNIRGAKLNGAPFKIENDKQRTQQRAGYFSPIEFFIAQNLPNQRENNRILIEYLKGKREKLDFY